MAALPAFCGSCGLVFPSPFGGDVGASMVFSDNHAQCPRCRAWGRVLEGEFNLIGDTVQLLRHERYTRDQLQHLVDVIDAGQRQGRDPLAIVADIGASPALTAVARYGRAMVSPQALPAWLPVLYGIAKELIKHV